MDDSSWASAKVEELVARSMRAAANEMAQQGAELTQLAHELRAAAGDE